MKKLLLAALIILTLSCSKNMQRKERIVFFGDSITQAGVLPGGYISIMETMLQEKGLAGQYKLIGAGINGNKVYDLYLRMEKDVLDQRPAAVVIWIGVNDVWHKQLFGTGTDADKFELFYTAIIKKMKANDIKVYACTPSAIGEKTDNSNGQDDDLDKYASIIRTIAQKNNVQLIDLRTQFREYLLQHNTGNQYDGILTTDGVHLNEAGNAFVAEAMMKAVVGS